MLLQVAPRDLPWGAAPPQWRSRVTAVALQLNQDPALGCCETGISADALRAPHARRFALNHTAVWLARRSHAAPPSGRVVDWVTPSDACCWAIAVAQQRPCISTCHCSGARVQGRRLQERVETRRPSACCPWPRLRHGPAPVKAGSLPSGVVAANREEPEYHPSCRRGGSRACVCLVSCLGPVGCV